MLPPLPGLQMPAWLGNGGFAAENNYLRITIGGHLQWHFTVPTAAVTGRKRRRRRWDAKHSVTAKASKPVRELSTPATLRLPVQSFL